VHRKKVILLSGSLVLAAVVAAVYFYLKLPTLPPAGPATVCTLTESSARGVLRSTRLVAGDPLSQEVIDYLNAPATLGGWWSLTSYAPDLELETDTIQLNFLGSVQVVSTRRSSQDVWNQSVRPMNARDSRMEAKLRRLLKSESASP